LELLFPVLWRFEQTQHGTQRLRVTECVRSQCELLKRSCNSL